MNNFKIVARNVRGMHDPRKRSLIGNLLRTWKADIVCLLESKLSFMDEATKISVYEARGWKWKALLADGVFGGILLGWKDTRLTLIDCREGNHSISCLFLSMENDLQWVFTSVYGPGEGENRNYIWRDIQEVR